jgi:hypothetical protein
MRAVLLQHEPNDLALCACNMRVVRFQKSYWNPCSRGTSWVSPKLRLLTVRRSR